MHDVDGSGVFGSHEESIHSGGQTYVNGQPFHQISNLQPVTSQDIDNEATGVS